MTITLNRITREAAEYGYTDVHRRDAFRRGFTAAQTQNWQPDVADYGTKVAWRHGYSCGMSARDE